MQLFITASHPMVKAMLIALEKLATDKPLDKVLFVANTFRGLWCVDGNTIIATDPSFPANCTISSDGPVVTMETPLVKLVIYSEAFFGIKPIGELYGYPACCNEWFQVFRKLPKEEKEAQRPTVLKGTGYVPCPQCSAKPEEELIRTINANRIAPLSFPKDDCLHELILIAWLRKTNLPLGDNLDGYEEQFNGFDFEALLKPAP